MERTYVGLRLKHMFLILVDTLTLDAIVIFPLLQVEGLMRDLRYGARIEDKAYKGMLDAIRRILAEEGLKGLYKGTLPSLVKAAPNSAIVFYVHESTVAWLTSYF
jgi:solute carrier family 25 thiamine pyrophosphate transporter 19